MRVSSTWFGDLFAHAPQLTRNWGPFRAFVAIFGFVAMTGVAIRPEVAIILAGIFVVGVGAALIAARNKWLN